MLKITELSFFLVLVGVIPFISCTQKPFSVGSGGSLIIIADQEDREILKSSIVSRFGRIIETPQPEPHFDLRWIDGDGLTDYTRFPVLLIAARMDGKGPTTDLLNRMLTAETKEGVESGDFALFQKHDPWARRQLLLILIGRNQTELGERIEAWSDSLYDWALRFEMRRLVGELNKRSRSHDFTYSIAGKAEAQLDLQTDYIETINNDSLHLVRFIRHHPERWLMFSWGKLPDDERPLPQFFYDYRESLGNYFADSVFTYEDRWQWRETRLNDLECILINGIWATHNSTGGGPFFTYCIRVPDTDLFCIIDGAVFAPGEAKMPFLWQLDVMAHSFRF